MAVWALVSWATASAGTTPAAPKKTSDTEQTTTEAARAAAASAATVARTTPPVTTVAAHTVSTSATTAAGPATAPASATTAASRTTADATHPAPTRVSPPRTGGTGHGTTTRSDPATVLVVQDEHASSPDAAPYHGSLENIAWGGHGELRFGYDLTAGVSDPSWFHVGRANGFFLAKLGSRLRLGGQASYDRVPDDFTLERAELIARLGRGAREAHAGIFLVPLGRTNLDHDAPQYEFGERSLVATEILGVPNAELGAGLRGAGSWSRTMPFTYEVDLVTGFDDGIVMDAAGGTRLPAGRNNYGDQNGLPALSARFAIQPSVDTEIGLSAQSGPYNQTKVDGVKVDRTRFVHVVAADAVTNAVGVDWAAEAAGALVDIPPSLEALYAQRQWGASLEATRVLRAPLFAAWHGTSLSGGLRAEKVDFDMGIPGDSRARVGASLNIRPLPSAIVRFGWYYEWRRDRFDNLTPLGGLTLTAASYF
ncbi:MAG TPA: hypothetical protein VFM00_02345 [Candidatus Eisenbacteria bacterium]|nr:hypothetical protein [Candidatus Eisenbacteria bacterium]